MTLLLTRFLPRPRTLGCMAALCLASLLPMSPVQASNFAYPMSGRVSDTYWARRSYGTHGGLDFAGDWHAPIYAARPGKVSYAGWKNGGYGWFVIIDHENGYQTYYEHMASRPLVKWGQEVTPATQVGVQGATGNAQGAHLHFEVVRNGKHVPQPERLNTRVEHGGEMEGVYPDLSDWHADERARLERERIEREARERREREEREAREREERARREREEREARERREREEREARERREREERERREREERERLEREERELGEATDTLRGKVQAMEARADEMMAAASQRSLAGRIAALVSGELARERQQLDAIEESQSSLLAESPVPVKRRMVRMQTEEREAVIDARVQELQALAAGIRSGQQRSLLRAVAAYFMGTVARETRQLRALDGEIARLEKEAGELAALRGRMEADPEFDPTASAIASTEGTSGLFSRPARTAGASATLAR